MRRPSRASVLLCGMLAVLLGATAPAYAHEHPSGITDLVTPAVVRVEAVAHVDITLLDHVAQLVHVERSYEVPIGTGTGVVVNPEGAVVTVTGVVRSDRDVAIYAANKIFAEHHKVSIEDDFERHEVDDPLLNRHLQDCYPPKKPTATCIVDVTPEITVYPNISPADDKGFKAEIAGTGDRPEAPAVLVPAARADGGTGLPTAPLAGQVPDKEGSPVAVAGFTGRPAPGVRHQTDIGHLGAGGAGEGGRPFKDPEGKVDEPEKLGALIDKGLLGAPVIGDRDGAVIGLMVGGGDDARMIGIREVTAALAQAKTAAKRGSVDSAFEVALTRYHNNFFGDAVPAFQRVLELYPGHVVAATLLRTAQEKRGGPEDAALKSAQAPAGEEEPPLWPILAGAGVLVLAVLVVVVLLWRRRGDDDPDSDPDPDGDPGTAERPAGSGEHAPAPPPVVVGGFAPPGGPARNDTPGHADQTVVVGRPRSFPAASRPVPQDQPLVTAKQSPAKQSPAKQSPAKQSPAPQSPAQQGPAQQSPAKGPSPVSGVAPPGAAQAQAAGAVRAAAQEPEGRAGQKAPQKYCTACGMGLGPVHRFCGYCGHPTES
ncbi:hypothetical protein Misp01_57620 [Microtetraspora sp. NBRC 13810]|uniref:zinc ribbon domain-containing protein n=1 Tax=Microtetraspora sp. NBRC 13810 TaxID=3030990 RepID=UPI0024A3F0F4|nr:hypothetical protein [Microtetraspora sp. NBRC 13810]GLW10634.1 hypothetical protein Misp01_57620 [Microtetraspora sp. NBRC 13810]